MLRCHLTIPWYCPIWWSHIAGSARHGQQRWRNSASRRAQYHRWKRTSSARCSNATRHAPEEQTLLRVELLERAAGLDTLVGRSIAPQEVIAAFQQVLDVS